MKTMSLKGGLLEYVDLSKENLEQRYMDGESPKGRKVKFRNQGGWDADLKHALLYLSEGLELTVQEIYVGRSSSKVSFIEFPGKTFNTVMFEDVEEIK